jgi:arabinan endo-1,5-alpha-L-arabinosidase
MDNVEESNSAIYDLQGRRISQPTRPGIYIRNGKKYIK